MVSSDKCTKEAIDRFYMKKRNKDLPLQKAIQASKGAAKAYYKEDITRAIKRLRRGKNLIILDKNDDSPFAINKLYNMPPKRYGVRTIAVVPDDNSNFKFSGQRIVPYSASLILNVCDRVLNRKDHQTLNGSPESKLMVTLSFVLLNEGVKDITEKKREEVDLDGVVRVPFHRFSSIKSISKDIFDVLSETMDAIRPFKGNGEECEELAKMLTNTEVQAEL